MICKTVSSALLAFALLAQAPVAEARNSDARGDALIASKVKPAAAVQKEAQVETEALRSELKQAVAEVASVPRKGRLWCVPFARAVSGIELKGNAVTWWKQAASRYQRGSEPQVGAVMNFRATNKMPMGHVAVVSKVVDERRILIDQANWERNRITQDTLVIDISAQNDWSKVRVENSAGSMGAPYPVFGFIYR